MKRLACLLFGLLVFAAHAASTSHPRLWLTAADVPRLRAWAVASNPLFEQGLKPLVEEARAAMDRGDVPALDCGSTEYESYPTEMYAELFAFMSLVDNDATARADYAARARSLLMHIIGLAALGPASADDVLCPASQSTGYPPFRSPEFLTEDSNRARWHGEAYALVVDWIYPSLSVADKAAIRGVFLRWSQEIIERGYHHPEPVGAINDPAMLADVAQVRWAGNNYFTGHMRNLGLMALAFDAADDSGNQLRNYLAHATGAWLPLFDRLTRTDARGGFLPEGFEYSPQTASYAIQFLLALRTAGADDCGSPCQVQGNPFWDDFLTGYYHSLSPAQHTDENGLTAYQPAWYGDAQTYATTDLINVFGPLGAFDALAGNSTRLQSLRWAQTHTPAGGAGALLRRVSNTDEFRHALLYFMLFDPAAAPPGDPRSQLASEHFAPGLNRLLARTGWDSAASWFNYSLSWSLIDHQQANAGEFGWYRKGEWLTKQRTGYADIAEGIGSSEFSNTLAIENDQPNRDASDWRTDLWQRGAQWNLVASGDPRLLAHSSQAAFSYVSGDATALYNSSREAVNDVLHASRDVVWLKPDAVVVYDRAQTRTANRFKRWWLQSATPASISGQAASITTAGGQRLQISSLLPANASLTAVNTNEVHIEDTVAGNEPMKVRLRIDAPGNPSDVRFLQVLQAADAGMALTAPALIQSQDAAWQGAQVGNTVVMFAKTPASPLGSLVYDFTAPVASHIITGTEPNTAYCVSVTGNRLSLSPGCSQLSDGGGVVTFADSGTGVIGGNQFAGPRSNYRVVRTSTGFSVTDLAGSSTVLAGVTSIAFADVRVNLLIGEASKTIAAADLKTLIELYVAFFNRVPEADGLAYWIGRVQAGMTLDQIADAFYQAAVAYSALTGYASSMSHTDFVRIIYQNVLGRTGATTPPDEDVQYWAGQLGSGQASRGTLLDTMLKSAHSFAGDATWGWVPQLLDNKVTAATLFALQQGLNYNTSEESISKGMAIAAAVTAAGIEDAVRLMNLTDTAFDLTLP